MNISTGEIKDESDLTLKEKRSGEWIHLTDEQAECLKLMSRNQRKAWFQKEVNRIFQGEK